jgi:NADPH-dependent glutamate synthase beta subunit-like oxidoreductase/bacterioferritin-associated ferredoxin
MKEIRTQAVIDATKCTGCATCLHVCPTVAYSRKEERPVERHRLSPCGASCPAGNDIEGLLTLVQKDKWDEALDLLMATNPLPGVTGRVCNNPCEQACNRGYFDQPLSIRAVERALADYAAERLQGVGTWNPRYEQRVAVIGSGPAGLSCASFLGRQGFEVTVFEQMPQVGGILRYGIPKYRLPRDVLDREVDSLRMQGIDFKVGYRFGESLKIKDIERYDAVFFAPGLAKHRKLGIPGEDCSQVLPGFSFLERVNSGEAPELGRHVLVIGGGNSAVDSARSVLRMGIKPTLVYRRGESDMPAIVKEIEELKTEGMEILSLTAPVRFIHKNGKLSGMECIRMEPGEIGADGRRQPIPIARSEFIIPADTVIYSIGETRDLEWIPPELSIVGEKITANDWGQTSMAKVFVGGDFATGLGTVAHAIGSGRRSAQAIVSYLLGETSLIYSSEKPVVTSSGMNFDYLDPAPRLVSPQLPVELAVSCFDEIHKTSPRNECISEAQRCLHCGVVPDFNAEYCRGCSNCSSRCPSYAISLKELERPYLVKVDVEAEMIEEICQICEKAVIHPESLVCQCTGTRADEIVAAILKGAATVVDIRRMTGAHTGCGSACISPIFRLMEAAGLEIAVPPQSDMYYPSPLTIWDVSDKIARDFEARGFRFKEDKEFFNNWLGYIRAYGEKKKEREG